MTPQKLKQDLTAFAIVVGVMVIGIIIVELLKVQEMKRKNLFKTGVNGKLDVSVKVFNKNNELIYKSDITYDNKPTIKEVLNSNFVAGAKFITIFSSPSFVKKTFEVTIINK